MQIGQTDACRRHIDQVRWNIIDGDYRWRFCGNLSGNLRSRMRDALRISHARSAARIEFCRKTRERRRRNGPCVSFHTLFTVTTAFAESRSLGTPIMESAGGDERLLGDSWRLEIAKSTPARRADRNTWRDRIKSRRRGSRMIIR